MYYLYQNYTRMDGFKTYFKPYLYLSRLPFIVFSNLKLVGRSKIACKLKLKATKKISTDWKYPSLKLLSKGERTTLIFTRPVTCHEYSFDSRYLLG